MKTILTTLHSKYIHPSLALPYLAAYCTPQECGTIIISEFTIHEPRENILAVLIDENPDVIAFSVYIWNRSATMELVDALHTINPQLRIVLGGPEVSFEDATIWQQHCGITAIVRGEGEQPLQELLHQWYTSSREDDTTGTAIARVTQRVGDNIIDGGDSEPLENLDIIPSPFQSGFMDCQRGFVYYETSRGCPYRCVFCMSALDVRVRSFSMARIEQDLLWLMQHDIPKIKLVDRTFNYDAARARHIFSFILQHNRCSHFHFEIGAHLLDDATLKLLRQVPEDTFQFEIGVQSILPQTLKLIKRTAPLQLLEHNVRQLLQHSNIHLHLDLIAGLPGENFTQMLRGIDHIMALQPDHLQIETVKLLPGAPLRRQAATLGIFFDPNPPYQALRTPEMSFTDLERVRSISRLLDITWNNNRARNILTELAKHYGSSATAIAALAEFWQRTGLLRFPLAQKEIFEQLGHFIQQSFSPADRGRLLEVLARDFALTERITMNNTPSFFNTELSATEQLAVKAQCKQRLEQIKGQGIKLQHLAVCFEHLNASAKRQIHLFYYLTATGRKMEIEEQVLAL
ncbi:MAG: radical SAM protein [Desulfuromonas sp.]|nr:radical SAM protein [Desulfuromonas sp.]